MPKLFNYATKNYEEIPEEQVTEKVRSRNYGFPDAAKVPVIGPNGDPYVVPGNRVYEFFQSGGTYGSTEQWDNIKNKELYGEGALNAIGATAAAVARGATLGASDVALAPLLSEERLSTWKEEMPAASIGGEVAGSLLGFGKLGAVSKVASKLPAAQVFKGSKKIEESLAGAAVLSRAADKNLAGKVLASAAPKGIAGAIEGAAFGAGSVLSEAALGDPEEAGEMLLANIGYSALFGGAAGAGVDALMLGGAGSSRKVSDGIASLYNKATNSTMSKKGQDKFLDLAADLTGAEREATRKRFGLYEEAREGRAAAIAKEETFRQQQDTIVSDINDMLDNVSKVAAASRGGAKQENMRGLIFQESPALPGYIGNEKPAAALAASQDLVEEIVDDLAALHKADIVYSWSGATKKLGKHGQALSEALNGQGTAALKKALNKFDLTGDVTGDVITAAKESYLLLDDYKKLLGVFAFSKNPKNQIGFNTQGKLREVYTKIHDFLENDSLWGQAAVVQKAINPKFSRLIKAENNFLKVFRDNVQRDKIQTRKIGQYLKNLEGRDGLGMEASYGIEKEEVFNEFLSAAEDFAASAQRYYGLTGDGLTAAQGAQSLAKKTNDSVTGLIQDMRETRFINEAAGGQGFNPGIGAQIFARFGGAALGGAAFGPVGAAAGAILGGVADGARAAKQLSLFEHHIIRSRKNINKRLDDVVEQMSKGGPDGTIPVRPNRTKLFLAPLAAQFGEAKAEEELDKQSEFSAAKSRAMRLTDVEALDALTENIVSPMRHDAPELSTAVKAKLLAGVQVALEGFGKDSRNVDDQLMGIPERQPTDRELAQQEIRLRVIEDPINTIMDNLEHGTLTGTHVDALQKAYPSLYLNIVAGLMDRVSSMEEPAPYAWRRTMSVLFKRPFDVSHKAQNISVLQSSFTKSDGGTTVRASPTIKNPGMELTEVGRIMAS